MQEYDFVIVGAGTAGCVLAARLTEDPGARVLLLEAGSGRRPDRLSVPAAWPGLVGGPADWGSRTTPQADAGPLPYPRGRGLGGSGAINAMAHVRGHRAVYDAWAAAGADGWAHADLLPYLKRSERADGRDPAVRGILGPVRVAPVPETGRHPVARALAESLCAAGYRPAADLSGHVQEGVAWPDLAIRAGRRVSPVTAYLRPARSRPNLVVETDCLVLRLEMSRGHCTGVTFVRDGTLAQAFAAREVIVCAGAVGSPQLLMLSGIGPADALRDLGIDVLAPLPGVGANLQDHPVALACYALETPLPGSRYNHGETYAAIRSGLAVGDVPDLQLFPILLPVGLPVRRVPGAGFALATAVLTPDSRGSVRLSSADPSGPPLIDPGFLREARDLDRLETGLAILRRAAARAPFARLGVTEALPGPGIRASGAVRRYIRRTVGSYYHPVGTCRIGTDDGAVVDPSLRVHGVSGLRVADASVMPDIPNAHPHATVLAIAEKAADLISPLAGATAGH